MKFLSLHTHENCGNVVVDKEGNMEDVFDCLREGSRVEGEIDVRHG